MSKNDRQGSQDDGYDVSAAEAEALTLLATDPEERTRFWGMFQASYEIQAWGFGVYLFFHQCPCPEHAAEKPSKPCRFAGRRMIELSSGKCQDFLKQLQTLTLPAASEATRQAMRALAAVSQEHARLVTDAFLLAKQKVSLRFQQGSSFYSTFPWNVCRLLNYVQKPRGAARRAAVENSKLFAKELLDDWESGSLPRQTFATRFLQGHLRQDLEAWSVEPVNIPMRPALLKELLSYSLSLVVMQRLESRHHLVNMKMTPSRAASAAAVSAALRRKLNEDIHAPEFRRNFERYLHEFEKLVPEQWGTMAELHKLVSGHNLDIMFKGTATADALISAASTRGASSNSQSMLELQAHVKSALTDGGYYALPVAALPDGSTKYNLIQFVSNKPESKKYMEKILN